MLGTGTPIPTPERAGPATAIVVDGKAYLVAIVGGGAIGDVLRPPVRRAMEPFLKKAISNEDYHKWIRPGLNYACKLVAVSIAWTLQRIISAFHSAVRGGQIAGDALVVMLKNAGVLKHGPHDSFADEVVGYLLAFFVFSLFTTLFFLFQRTHARKVKMLFS